MKILEDLWASISGNAKTKINDPFIGAFSVSWITCNWNHLAILIWGEGNVSTRINEFQNFLSESEILAFNTIIFYPALFTMLYLFLFPWISLLLKSLQKAANEKLHMQAVDFEYGKVTQQEKLNKAKLLSNPNREFLAQSVQIEIEIRKEEVSILNAKYLQESEKAKAEASNAAEILSRAEAEAANAAEAKSRAEISRLEEEHKNRIDEIEREKFNVTTSKLRSIAASNRFPSVYLIMSMIEDSLSDDGIQLSLTNIGKIMAAFFGYKNIQEIIEDKDFNSDTLSRIEYIFYNRTDLAEKLEKIVSEEEQLDEALSAELIFDRALDMFEELSLKLVTFNDLEEIVSNFFDNNSFDLLQNEGLSGEIAMSDTIYEEVEFKEILYTAFEKGMSASVLATATGGHRKESDMPGRVMEIKATIKSTSQLGKYAFGSLVFSEAKGELVDM